MLFPQFSVRKFYTFVVFFFFLDNCKFMRRSDGGSWPWKQISRCLCCCSDSAQHRQMETKKGFVDVKVVNEEVSLPTCALGTVATLLTSALLTTHLISQVSSLLLCFCFCFCFSCKSKLNLWFLINFYKIERKINLLSFLW